MVNRLRLMAETLAVSEMVIFRFFCRISPIKLRPRTWRGHYSRSKVVANLNVITSTSLNLQIGDFLEFLIETASFLASLLFSAALITHCTSLSPRKVCCIAWYRVCGFYFQRKGNKIFTSLIQTLFLPSRFAGLNFCFTRCIKVCFCRENKTR